MVNNNKISIMQEVSLFLIPLEFSICLRVKMTVNTLGMKQETLSNAVHDGHTFIAFSCAHSTVPITKMTK